MRLESTGTGHVIVYGHEVCCDGARIYAVWQDSSINGETIRFNYNVP